MWHVKSNPYLSFFITFSTHAISVYTGSGRKKDPALHHGISKLKSRFQCVSGCSAFSGLLLGGSRSRRSFSIVKTKQLGRKI